MPSYFKDIYMVLRLKGFTSSMASKILICVRNGLDSLNEDLEKLKLSNSRQTHTYVLIYKIGCISKIMGIYETQKEASKSASVFSRQLKANIYLLMANGVFFMPGDWE